MPDSNPPHRYQQIARSVAASIADGTLRAGERLPSLRRMSRRQGVSVATVLQAYMQLESNGLVAARPQSGFYVCHQETLPSAPQRQQETLPAPQENVVNAYEPTTHPQAFALGYPRPAAQLLPINALKRAARDALGRVQEQVFSQVHIHGADALTLQIARQLANGGIVQPAQDLLITSEDGLSAICRSILNPGERLLAFSPCSRRLLQIAAIHGLSLHEIRRDAEGQPDVQQLEKALRVEGIGAIALASDIDDPTGQQFSLEAKRQLVALANAAKVPIIEDHSRAALAFSPVTQMPCKHYDTHGNVLLWGHFKHTVSPTLNVTWIAPGRFHARLLHRQAPQAADTLSQLALANYLQHSHVERHIAGLKRHFQRQLMRIADLVNAHFPTGCTLRMPKGGQSMWVRLPPTVEAQLLCNQALAENIAVAPGHLFTQQAQYSHHIRLCAGDIWDEQIEQALLRLGELIKAQLR